MGAGGGGIATCSVCGRISASGGDHLDCGEMRRARLEDERIGAEARNELFGPDAGSRGDGAGKGAARRPSALGRSA